MIDYFRKNSHKEIVSDEIISKFSEENGYTERNSEKREIKEEILKAISQLSTEQQDILTLFYTNDLSYKEISEIMQLSISSVESLLFRARKNLQKKLWINFKTS